METKETEPEIVRLVCKKCSKLIIGLARGQAEHNMRVHKMTHEAIK
jgi:hypothetical protein